MAKTRSQSTAGGIEHYRLSGRPGQARNRWRERSETESLSCERRVLGRKETPELAYSELGSVWLERIGENGELSPCTSKVISVYEMELK
jgi:hypothetical protein